MTTLLSKLPRLFTVSEVAQHANVCSRSVRRWIKDGQLSVHRLGRQLRVSEDDLLAFLRLHRN
jgi:excisionase family DNA binding protein